MRWGGMLMIQREAQSIVAASACRFRANQIAAAYHSTGLHLAAQPTFLRNARQGTAPRGKFNAGTLPPP